MNVGWYEFNRHFVNQDMRKMCIYRIWNGNIYLGIVINSKASYSVDLTLKLPSENFQMAVAIVLVSKCQVKFKHVFIRYRKNCMPMLEKSIWKFYPSLYKETENVSCSLYHLLFYVTMHFVYHCIPHYCDCSFMHSYCE